MGRVEPPPPRPRPAWEEEPAKILLQDWKEAYQNCPTFSEVWEVIQKQDGNWPGQEHKIFKEKLFCNERLCVPWDQAKKVVQAHHRWNAHQSEDRLIPDLILNYEFPRGFDVTKTVRDIKNHVWYARHAKLRIGTFKAQLR